MHIFNYKKSILKNPKISETVFFFAYCFSNTKKKHTYKSENFWDSFFCLSLFQILKKSILTNLKIPETVFLLIAFSNTKKAHLRIWKFLRQFYFLIAFSNTKKMNTYESENFWNSFFLLIAFSNTKKSTIGINIYTLTLNKNTIFMCTYFLTIFNYKKHHMNKYIYIYTI